MNGALLAVSYGLNLLFTVIIPDVQAALHIKSVFDLNPDFTVNVTTLTGDAITADDTVLDTVNAWRVKNGLSPLSLPPSTPPAPLADVAGN